MQCTCLEPGIPRVAARLHVHLYVAACQLTGTRDPRGLDPVYFPRRRSPSQRAPGGTTEIKPSLGAAHTSEKASEIFITVIQYCQLKFGQSVVPH